MILTLTINPAVDRTISVDRLVFEDRAYILASGEAAGGRGINGSRVIHSFGGKTLAVITSGGKGGEKLEKLLVSSGFPVEVVRIKNEIRTNLTISDRQGLTIKLNELGPAIEKAELDTVERTIATLLPKATWLMLCGSLPPGVPGDFYRKLIFTARKKDVKTLLDTDGEALAHGLDAGPTVVTPNQPEAERLLNRVLITRAHFLEAAERVKSLGAESVILSLGSRGAITVDDHRMLEVHPPRIEAVCPIGAGDAMAAAFVWAMAKRKDFAESVRWGVAAGAASARLPGVDFASLQQTKEIFKSVEVRPV